MITVRICLEEGLLYGLGVRTGGIRGGGKAHMHVAAEGTAHCVAGRHVIPTCKAWVLMGHMDNGYAAAVE